jgi:hypothetical protein
LKQYEKGRDTGRETEKGENERKGDQKGAPAKFMYGRKRLTEYVIYCI